MKNPQNNVKYSLYKIETANGLASSDALASHSLTQNRTHSQQTRKHFHSIIYM